MGAARRALELLGVEIAVFAASGLDAGAAKVVRNAWPEVQLVARDALACDATLRAFYAAAPHLQTVIINASLPGRGEREESLQGIKRDLEDLAKLKAAMKSLRPEVEVFTILENVCGLTEEAARVTNASMRVLPLQRNLVGY